MCCAQPAAQERGNRQRMVTRTHFQQENHMKTVRKTDETKCACSTGWDRRPGNCPGAPRMDHKSAKIGPRAPQERPRASQEWPKSAPRAPQERPREPQERPRDAQERPKASLREAQEGPRRVRSATQEAIKRNIEKTYVFSAIPHGVEVTGGHQKS